MMTHAVNNRLNNRWDNASCACASSNLSPAFLISSTMRGSTPPRPLPNPQPSSSRRASPETDVPILEKENLVLKSPRPLPTPAKVAPVSPSSFYASTTKPSTKPQPRTVGSVHTTYAPPSSPPPYHIAKETSPFREPELVHEDPIAPLVPAADTWGHVDTTPWDSNWASWDTPHTKKVDIDGRNDVEERDWCDEATREQHRRPGPGILPPLLSHCLHNPEHTLYFVTASAPPLKHSAPAPASNASATSTPGSSSASPPPHGFSPPTADEIRTAIPHPNAYYCKEHNGWVLLSWCSSTVLPPFVPSYHFEHPLPDNQRRKKTPSCVGDESELLGRANRTHHFHKYAAAVDARHLTTPYKRSDWEAEVRQKRRNRSVTLRIEGNEGETSTPGEKHDVPEGDLLDLYICCQCSVYCLVSREIIPGVIPVRRVEEFVKDKVENPPVGKTGAVAIVSGWETIITYVSTLHLRTVYLILSLSQYISLVLSSTLPLPAYWKTVSGEERVVCSRSVGQSSRQK